MKKIFLFYLILITLLWCGLMLAQESSLVTDPKAKVVTQFLNPDAECTGAGELIYDDGTFEDGFGWNSTVTDGRIVTLFTPHSYPWQFNTFCLALTRLAAGTPNFTFDIVMYDNTGAGGTPGNQIGIVAGVTAIDIPIWTTLAFYDFDITSMPPLASGSIYIGIKYNPSLVASPHYSLVDQTTTTTLHPGYAMSDGSMWQTIQSLLPGYKAMSYRTLGSSNCTVEPASNPDPPNGSTDISIYGTTLNWVNGVYTLSVELWFGPEGDVSKVYDGPAITSWPTNYLNYETTYQWRVVCKNDTCSTGGQTWSFTTAQNPNVIYIYPQNVNYWTGTCDSIIKTQVSLVNANGSNFAGWMVFDVSTIPLNALILEIEFHSFLYANNWPYWSITPMGNVNPVTANAETIFNQVSNNCQQDDAYSFNQETGTLPNGWISRELGNGAANHLQTALQQGWFATGIYEWDAGSVYFIRFHGWAENNIPYLRVTLDWCLSCVPPNSPTNLSSQVIFNPNPQVQLNWQDNSYNEYGFKIYRKFGYPNDPGEYIIIDTTFTSVIQFIDASVIPESTYTYRVFAYNPWGQNGSNTATIAVPVPVELISFSSDVDENVVTLFWQTATETNNRGFEIERLQDSKIEKLQSWERIGFVEGKGTTTEIQSYSFTDKPEQGKYKYRLKQIDFDGTFAYSPEVEAEVKAPNVFSLEQNYPNPFNPNTVFSYQLPVSSKVELKIYDVLGKEVEILVNEEQPAGNYEIEFSTSSGIRDLVSGIYFYQLRAGDYIETKKMILLK